MRRVKHLVFCLSLLLLLKPVFCLGGLQKQKVVISNVGEEVQLEVLIWSNKEEEVEISYSASEELDVKLTNKTFRISPFVGDEIVAVGNSYYNASLVRVYVKPKTEGMHKIYLIVSTKPNLEGLTTRKEIIFNFIVNASYDNTQKKKEVIERFLDRIIIGEYLVIIIAVFSVLTLSYLIYKKS